MIDGLTIITHFASYGVRNGRDNPALQGIMKLERLGSQGYMLESDRIGVHTQIALPVISSWNGSINDDMPIFQDTEYHLGGGNVGLCQERTFESIVKNAKNLQTITIHANASYSAQFNLNELLHDSKSPREDLISYYLYRHLQYLFQNRIPVDLYIDDKCIEPAKEPKRRPLKLVIDTQMV